MADAWIILPITGFLAGLLGGLLGIGWVSVSGS